MWLDENGAVELGRQIGRRGGEGSVFEVTGRAGVIAKVYHEAPTPEKVAKLNFLTRAVTPDLLRHAAWPAALLWDERRHPRGFTMPFVQGKEIHSLFDRTERAVEFPAKGWDFLVHVARNCAVAFESVHAVGAIIGDVNEGNFLVGRDGIARLIDCDSYQVRHGNTTWTCNVGVPFWTAPELQGKDFRNLERTANHDRFGLAVLIFKLLFMGRHPFAGIPTTHADIMLEDMIERHLFAYSSQAPALGVRPPPFSLPLTSLPESYRLLFDRAFLKGSENDARPHAKQWVQALDVLLRNLTQCAQDSSHKFPRNLSKCPWCEIARAGGPTFFIAVSLTVPVQGTDIVSAWEAITRIQRITIAVTPLEQIKFPVVQPSPLPPGLKAVRPQFLIGSMLIAAGLILIFSGALLPGLIAIMFGCGLVTGGLRGREYGAEKARRFQFLEQKRKELAARHQELTRFTASLESDFDTKRGDAQKAYERLMRLDQERMAEVRKLEAAKRQLQLNEFLDHQLISHVDIPGLGPVKKSRLFHYGIESALDIRPDMTIPGFGPVNKGYLLAWRQSCEWRFHYDPAKGIPAQEMNQLNARFSSLRHQLTSQLTSGAKSLASLNASARSRSVQLQAQLDNLIQQTAQAAAELKALTS